MKKLEFKKNLTKKIALTLGIGMFSIMPMVQALPTGGTSDTATISTSGTTMNISGAANNVINWKGFSIAKGETVAFDANNYLNLVNGPDISNIYGTLKGAGNIFLVNPNGIVFGSGAVINVGSLTASTAPINSVDTTAFLNNGNTASITGSVTGGSDISMALVNVESANSLVLNAGEIVLQNTDVLDKVTQLKGNGNVYIGSADGNLTLNSEQQAKVTGTTANYAGAKLVTDLSTISSDMTGTYLLAGNVTAGEGFTSLGAVESAWYATGFTGYFNGLGYTVNNLSGSNGLFAKIGALDTESSSYNSGTVKNLRLENVNITGSGEFGTGALAGSFLKGTVSNIYVSGNITAAPSFTGGIVGTMGEANAALYEGAEDIADVVSMRNVENTATIGADSADDLGGVVGMFYGGVITNAKNSGTISGAYNVGGIAGQSLIGFGATAEYVYNSGVISATGTSNEGYDGGTYTIDGTAGGVVGSVVGWGAGETTVSIDNAYSSGTITGDVVGGIIGAFTDESGAATLTPTVTNSYYANVTNSTGNTYGTSVSATELQSKVAEIWGISGSAAESEGTDIPINPSVPTDNNSTNNDSNNSSNSNSQPSISNMSEIFSLLEEMGVSTREETAVLNDIGSVTKPETGERGNSPLTAMPMTEGTNGFGVGADTKLVENTDMAAPTGTPGAEPGTEPAAQPDTGTEPAAGAQGEASNDNSNNNDNDNGENDEENNENA